VQEALSRRVSHAVLGYTAPPEALREDHYWVVLTKQPTGPVHVNITTDSQIAVVGSTTLTFTTANWNVAQRITVRALDDSAREGTHYSRIGHSILAADLDHFLGVTRQDVADGLANAVNGDLGSEFTAQTGTNSVTVTGPAFEAELLTPYTAATVTLGGTPLAGQSWTLTRNGTPYVYTVQSGNDLNAVAQGLATLLGGTASGNSLSLSSAGAVFTLSFKVSAGSNGHASVSGTTLGFTTGSGSERAWTQAEIEIFDPATPPPPVGAVWTVFLDGVAFEYTRQADGSGNRESINNVAAGLADAINQSGGRFATKYTSATVKISGTPNAGDRWLLMLDGTLVTHLDGDSVTYIVKEGDTLASVANALAAAVGARGGFTLDNADDEDALFTFTRSAAFAIRLDLTGVNLQSDGQVSGTTNSDRLYVFTPDGTPFTVRVQLAASASQADGFVAGGRVVAVGPTRRSAGSNHGSVDSDSMERTPGRSLSASSPLQECAVRAA